MGKGLVLGDAHVILKPLCCMRVGTVREREREGERERGREGEREREREREGEREGEREREGKREGEGERRGPLVASLLVTSRLGWSGQVGSGLDYDTAAVVAMGMSLSFLLDKVCLLATKALKCASLARSHPTCVQILDSTSATL